MPEMPNAGEYHRHSMVVTGLDRVRVAHGAAGLDDRCDACFGGFVDIIAEGEEGVGSQHAAARALAGLADGQMNRIHPAHLTGADAHHHPLLAQHDGVTLNVLAHQPGEAKIIQLGFGRLTFGDDFQVGKVVRADVASLDEQAAVDTPVVEISDFGFRISDLG